MAGSFSTASALNAARHGRGTIRQVDEFRPQEKNLSHTPAGIDPAPGPARQDREAPSAVAVEGWRYHHIGIPTETPRPGERYFAHLKVHVSGFESSPYGIQWMRFDADAPYPEIIKSVPHVAFEVDDLAAALEGKEILVPPNCPGEGITVAMILDDGAPVELLEFQAGNATVGA